jgi:alpha-N-arabinofuranosidase
LFPRELAGSGCPRPRDNFDTAGGYYIQSATISARQPSQAARLQIPSGVIHMRARATTLFVVAALVSLVMVGQLSAQPGRISVKVDQPGAKIDPMMYGLMTEEINFSYDGGLYGELIRNRKFSDPPAPPPRGRGNPGSAPAASAPAGPPDVPFYWSPVADNGSAATIITDKTDPVNDHALKLSLRIDITGAAQGKRAGVANAGYWGIPVRPNWTYNGSFYARASDDFAGPIVVAVESNDGKTTHASAVVQSVGKGWQKHNVTLKTSASVTPSADNRFTVTTTSPGKVWLSLVSLFPPTYKNRTLGNRIDIMELLAEMKPAFLRFPGGNYVEGRNVNERFAWKKTIGPLEDRPGHPSPWRYQSSDGMGQLEFLLWCEELNMEPLICVYSGLHLDGGRTTITGEALRPYLQEALEQIEYTIGDPVTTRWGAERAKHGHPEPFKLQYVEVGNEEHLNRGMDTYDERFTMYYDAIKAKFPHLKVISAVPSGFRNFRYTRRPDVIDDHYYWRSVPQALAAATRYDNYDRSAPKIFVGEYATRVGNPTPTMAAAVGDAAFLTGCERNADVVILTAYAPLFVNVNPGGMQWPTDLIGYDALNSFGSPSYYAQKLFSNNLGSVVLPIEVSAPSDAKPITATTQGGNTITASSLYASASRHEPSGDIILKVVSAGDSAQQVQIDLQGAGNVASQASIEVISGASDAVNSIAAPTNVAPRRATISNAGASFTHEFPAWSVTVLRLKTR